MIKNLEDVKKVGIHEVISREISLQASGPNYKACCPFHGEKSPSFYVTPSKYIFKCFGCGEGGDSIEFIMKFHNKTFYEAVEHIAKEHHVRLDIENNEQYTEHRLAQQQEKDELETLQLVNDWAAKVYFDNNSADFVKNTSVDGRLLSQNTITKFGICYTSDDSGLLRVKSVENAVNVDKLLEVGLLNIGEHGSYDFFRKRYLFPIQNKIGRVVGFGGRKPNSDTNDKNPKYLNSKDSKVYKKSELLYGLFQNRAAIAKAELSFEKSQGFAYIVEGYMDVVTMYDFGIRNAVAPCGTALTELQIKELKKLTNTVVICFDADAAGRSATMRSIELLVSEQFKVLILQLPTIDEKKQDPDSFLRKMFAERQKKQAFSSEIHNVPYFDEVQRGIVADEFTSLIKDDALEYIVLDGYNHNDPFSKIEKMQIAAKMLSYYDSSNLVNAYIDIFCTRHIFGNVKKDLQGMIEAERDNLLVQNTAKKRQAELGADQTQDVLRYGIYERNSKYYYSSTPDSEGYELTNFTVKPLMLVIGNKRSTRLLEIENEHKYKTTIEIDSDEIIELSTFKKMVARKGNFTFSPWCKAEHYARIYSKISDNTDNAFPINTMGYSREGFYAFANGIVSYDGEFHSIDEYGIINYEKTKYYLPAFSKVRTNIKGDESGYNYEDIRNYYYPNTSEKKYDLKEWSSLMDKVYGQNGVVAVGWYIASIFRDIIHPRNQMFPHLNLFGLPQSGKNQLSMSICSMFGKHQPPIGLENATKHAMGQLAAVIRNGVVWFDEYKNDVDRSLVELLKGFADGTGRKKGDASTDRGIVNTPVNASCIVSGQHQLTLDIAMFSRVISLSFSRTEYSEEERRRLHQLQEVEKTGIFTHITAEIFKHRAYFEENFLNKFEQLRTDFQQLIPEGHIISDRVLNMYCIPLAASELIREKLEIGFPVYKLTDALLSNILTQKQSMASESEITIWWRTIDLLLSNHTLNHGEDILVEQVQAEKYNKNWSSKDTIDIDYTEYDQNGKKLLYINMTKTHPEYMKRHSEERKVKGLGREEVLHYLKTSDSFEGMKQNKKFGKLITRSCLVFDCDKLPFTVPFSFEVFAAKRTKMEDAMPEVEVKQEQPF